MANSYMLKSQQKKTKKKTKKKKKCNEKKNGSKKVVFAGETNGVEHQ
jgi:hypothetical protein